MKKESNYAFVDGQNLYMGTSTAGKEIDLKRFRIYLNDQHKVEKAYYFLGCVNEKYQEIYEEIQEAGFILIFRNHNNSM